MEKFTNSEALVAPPQGRWMQVPLRSIVPKLDKVAMAKLRLHRLSVDAALRFLIHVITHDQMWKQRAPHRQRINQRLTKTADP